MTFVALIFGCAALLADILGFMWMARKLEEVSDDC